MQIYIRKYTRKRPLHPGLQGLRPGVSEYCYVYVPARESKDGRPHLRYARQVGWLPYLAGLLARSERRRNREKRKRVRELEKDTQGRGRGRPRKHMDHELLEFLGAYRRGDRIVLSRKMPPDERARRRYTLLNSERRELLTVDEFISLERRVVSMRKRANRLGKAWDPNQAYAEAIQAILDEKGEPSQPDMPTVDDEQVARVDAPLPAAGR
jgi:hypothetical protein